MFFLRVMITSIFMVCVLSGNVFSSENDTHLQKKLGVAIKLGAQVFPDSELTDFWKLNPESGDLMVEMSYELKINQRLGLELSLGRMSMLAASDSTLEASDHALIDVDSVYASPTIKVYQQLTSRLLIFGGIGPDIYRTKGNIDYYMGQDRYKLGISKLVYGGHGLIGMEYYFSTNPAASGVYDWPVSIELQYRYTFAKLDEADKVLIDQINTDQDTSYASHELNVAGHSITIGLKWHLF